MTPSRPACDQSHRPVPIPSTTLELNVEIVRVRFVDSVTSSAHVVSRPRTHPCVPGSGHSNRLYVRSHRDLPVDPVKSCSSPRDEGLYNVKDSSKGQRTVRGG